MSSLDVKSLYPSLKTDQCTEAVRKVVLNSKIKLEGIEVKELGVLLRKNLTNDEITAKNLDNLIPTQRKKSKAKEKTKANKADEYDLWMFPKDNPTEMEVTIMFTEAIIIGVKLLMNNHIFIFNNQIYLQSNEGSTGVRLTGILAEIVMILWCKELSERLETAGVKNDILPRFVDDITMVPTIIPPGWKLLGEKLEYIEKYVAEDEKVSDDERTMRIIKEIADSISENITVTYDIPSNHSDQKVPILDLKAGINSVGEIEFMFYKKPVASKFVTLRSAALSMQQKMSSLTQQCFTRLHNTSESIDDKVKIDILNDFMYELHISGYSEKERLTILKGGINTYSNLKMQELSGNRPFYRPNSYQKQSRIKTKQSKKKIWFKGKNCDERYKSVMFIDATPGDKLVKLMKEVEEKFRIADDQRIKIVSKGGTKLVNLFERKNPFLENCKDGDCPPCDNQDKKNDKLSMCKVNNVCYEVKCTTCEVEGKLRCYTGETSRNLHVRSKEHIKDMELNNKNSWMLKHINEEHDGSKENVKFSWKVLRKHSKPLQRQLHEAIRIKNKADKENLNTKFEYNGQRITRISLSSKLQHINCNVCGCDFNQAKQKEDHMLKFHKEIKCTICEYLAFGESGIKEHCRVKHNSHSRP